MILNIIVLSCFFLILVQDLFYSYFQRDITRFDIYNFFTHQDDTFESFFVLWEIFIYPVVLFLLSFVLLLFIKSRILKYIIVALSIVLNIDFIKELVSVNPLNKKLSYIDQRELEIVRSSRATILLIIGESMKYNSLVEKKLKQQGFFYKKIYAGATNTDVALPLLFNAKQDPSTLGYFEKTNLFYLAKKNDYRTIFISMQTKKSLKYIKDYLQPQWIDYYKTYTKNNRKPLYDLNLLSDLKGIDLKKKSFIVLQQIGQHSPYSYHPQQEPDYNGSIEYSFNLYKRVYRYLKDQNNPFIMIYVSDHGEFTKEDGRYGHNDFNKMIYEVPMFITSNIALPQEYKSIKSHYQLSLYITYLLGYYEKIDLSSTRHIVNGTMIDREDGFIVVE
jgi:hypothetical protein